MGTVGSVDYVFFLSRELDNREGAIEARYAVLDRHTQGLLLLDPLSLPTDSILTADRDTHHAE